MPATDDNDSDAATATRTRRAKLGRRKVQACVNLPCEVVERVEAASEPWESFSGTLRRLVCIALDFNEHERDYIRIR